MGFYPRGNITNCRSIKLVFQACTGFDCIETTRAPNPPLTLNPNKTTSHPSESPSTSPTDEAITQQNLLIMKLWMNSYAGTSSKYFNPNGTNYTENLCDISHVDDYARIMLLQDTGGACSELQLTVSSSAYSYYIINTTSDGSIEKLGVHCQYSSTNNTCYNCRYSGDSITFGECDIVDVLIMYYFLDI